MGELLVFPQAGGKSSVPPSRHWKDDPVRLLLCVHLHKTRSWAVLGMLFAAPVTGKIVDERSSRVDSLLYYLLSGEVRDSGEVCGLLPFMG